MKLKVTAIAVALAFPLLASAQSSAQMQGEIDALKAQVKELRALVKGGAEGEALPPVDPEEFNRIKAKVEAADDVQNINGMKGLRISGGLDTVYIWNQNKNSGGFSFGNNAAAFSYDDSMFGVAYLDVQKEMEGGTKFHLNLLPTKSVGGLYNGNGSMIQEASASIPLDGNDTRLLVGQMPDVSGYEAWYPTYVGENSLSSNLLYPTYATNFVTHNLLFDFTGASYYTGVGLELVRGPWDTKLFVANMNASRADTGLSLSGNNQRTNNPAFIFNSTYAQEEFWGIEFTGYVAPNMPTPTAFDPNNPQGAGTSTTGTVVSFEIDGNYTRGNYNANLQFVAGTQQHGAYALDANGNAQDSRWWGLSALSSYKFSGKWSIAARADYLYNKDHGGGIFTLSGPGNSATPYDPNAATPCSTTCTFGDMINGFGPDSADPTGQTGTNRAALSLATTYRLSRHAALRGEFRRDFASTSAFYDYNSGNMTSANNVVALQALVNF